MGHEVLFTIDTLSAVGGTIQQWSRYVRCKYVVKLLAGYSKEQLLLTEDDKHVSFSIESIAHIPTIVKDVKKSVFDLQNLLFNHYRAAPHYKILKDDILQPVFSRLYSLQETYPIHIHTFNTLFFDAISFHLAPKTYLVGQEEVGPNLDTSRFIQACADRLKTYTYLTEEDLSPIPNVKIIKHTHKVPPYRRNTQWGTAAQVSILDPLAYIGIDSTRELLG